MRYTFLKSASILVSMIFLCTAFSDLLPAQTVPISPKTIRDSKGRDFWLAFPRNHHESGSNFDRIYISIVTERPTEGVLEYLSNAGQRIRVPLSLRANDVFTYEVQYSVLELFDRNISRTAVHITTDEEVTVYGLSVASTTSDAFLAFPTDVLGREYVIASYPSNILFNQGGRTVNTNTSTMSQFTIVAVQDSTVIAITPTVKTWNGDSTTYTIRLNQGQAYLVSLEQTEQNALKDFTGSRIIATKPIVVYGGHERAAIPVGQASSRDFLIEQMLPVEVWGKTALVVPYPTPSAGTRDFGCDRIRVIAGYDNTIVSVNGTTAATLQTGGFYEMVITTEASVVTSEPAVVMGYKCSARNNAAMLGDPFLAAIPPVEQFLSRYRFVCVQGTQLAQNGGNRTEPAFREHYVTVIVPTTKATTVVLNGGSIATQLFREIPGSSYSYASVPIFEGIHSISADTTFGITVAGFGRANSYGYIGGQRFETDIRPPQIVARRTCTGIDGVAFDSAFTDSKVFFYDTLRAAQRNVRFQFNQLPRPADSITFSADLLNIYEDGFLGLIVVDSLDLRTVQSRVIVPGFTLHHDPTIRTNAVVSTSSVLRLATGRDYCFRLPLTNYGATHQTVQSVGFTRGLREFSSAQRATRIEPNTNGTVEYCFRTDADGTFIDTLTISNGCLTRNILAIRIEAGTDRNPPTLTHQTDSCNRTVVLETADNRTFDAGVERIDLNLTNMTSRREFVNFPTTATERLDDTKRPTRVILTVSDPRRDAIYAVTVQDSVGNVSTVRDTIQGYTLRMNAASDTSSGVLRRFGNDPNATLAQEYRFRAVNTTSLTCGTILLQNVGLKPFLLDNTALTGNIRFSLPQAQFPIVIPAGGARLLTVCFNPPLVATYRDTLTVNKFCITEQLLLTGEGEVIPQLIGTRCTATIVLTPTSGSTPLPLTTTLPTILPGNVRTNSLNVNGSNANAANASIDALQVKHFPDPATESITLRIALKSAQMLSVRIFTMMGAEVANLPKQVLERGEWDMMLNLTGVESGAYFFEVRSESNAGSTATGSPEARWTGLIRIVR